MSSGMQDGFRCGGQGESGQGEPRSTLLRSLDPFLRHTPLTLRDQEAPLYLAAPAGAGPNPIAGLSMEGDLSLSQFRLLIPSICPLGRYLLAIDKLEEEHERGDTSITRYSRRDGGRSRGEPTEGRSS